MNTWNARYFLAGKHLLNTSISTIIFVQVDGIKHLVLNLFWGFFYCNGYRSCYFHFQNADKLLSGFSNLNHMNVGISPNCKFNLKYYFTGKTCWTRNIRFTVIYKGLRAHLCYTNAIFVNCMYFLYIGRETHRRKKKTQKPS